MSKPILRSVFAIIWGALLTVLLSVTTDNLLHQAGVFVAQGPSSDKALGLATAYRTLYGVLGAYVAARLAPYKPMAHALVLGTIGMVVSIIGTVATWNHTAEFGPHWYPISLVILALPPAWLGGKIREMQLRGKY